MLLLISSSVASVFLVCANSFIRQRQIPSPQINPIFLPFTSLNKIRGFSVGIFPICCLNKISLVAAVWYFPNGDKSGGKLGIVFSVFSDKVNFENEEV